MYFPGPEGTFAVGVVKCPRQMYNKRGLFSFLSGVCNLVSWALEWQFP